MRVCYDTEFHERGGRAAIEFISIGMVRDDGEEYYAISNAVQWWSVYKNVWLRENVLTQLPGKIKNFGNGGGTFEPDEGSGLYKPREQIAEEVGNFCYLSYGQKRDAIALWAYYGGYDHVVLAQLFGKMSDLPEHMPMFTNDLMQASEMLGVTLPERDDNDEHHALADARWGYKALERLTQVANEHWWLNV